jgi:RNA polymerase sigma-B factor
MTSPWLADRPKTETAPVATALDESLVEVAVAATGRSRDHFIDVNDMFRILSALDEDTPAFRRQRDAIFERCLPLADNIARRFRNRGESHDDLVQVARLGLVNAVKRFDVTSGSDFISFAVPTMMGEVRRHFRDHGWSLKVPRRLKELNLRLNSAKSELAQTLNRAPTASELAAFLELDREQVVEGLIASNAYNTHSTDMPTGINDDGRTIADRFGTIDVDIDRMLDAETVRPLLAALPDREREIVVLRFFEDMTQTQIAARMGISQMHVSRLLARSLATLRGHID